VDLGLGGFLASTAGLEDAAGVSRDYTAYAAQNVGKHKTPTLRNVNRRLDDGFVKAYGHNGVFKTLPQIVHFYNCRDVPVGVPPCDLEGMPVFPPAEVEENVDRVRLGNLGLQPMEGMALIKFLQTLDDGWAPPAD
jgi:cytochrome c peroxidase